jgi:hypothetical protein
MVRGALFCALLGALGIARADLGINIFGASYHFERDKAKELGLTNEVNPGLGLRWREPWRESFDVFADVGFYRDSARNNAVFAGGGVFWKSAGGLRLGGGLVLMQSDTYNDGDPFIAPAPVAAYEWRRVTLNVVYFPKFRDINLTNQLGFWVTVWP